MEKKNSLWSSKTPLHVLAPMAGITDAAFRRVMAKYGKPDITYTQFVSCEGLCSSEREMLLPDLWYHPSERPIVAQFFGADPEAFYRSAKLAVELGFDGIDLNMGCPDKIVLKHHSGASLIKYPEQAKDIIRATREGARNLPVSVKTRIGFSQIEFDTWLPQLLEENLDALIVHLRTKTEMSKLPAHWELAEKISNLAHSYHTPLIANGDVMTLSEAEQKSEQYDLDGVMLGRATLGNPWCFSRTIRKVDLPLKTVLKVMLEHAQWFETLFGQVRPFTLMRKHFGAYLNGHPKIKRLRVALVESHSLQEAQRLVLEATQGAI